MKKITNCFTWLTVLLLVLGTKNLSAQCAASFVYSTSGNGVYTFTSTSVGTNSAVTNYTWTYGNSTFSAGPGLNVVSTTYSVNGTYTVNFAFSNPCMSNTFAIITVTNATGCTLNANMSYSQGSNGLVNFNNLSTGTTGSTTYTLAYGDGATSSGFTSHTYAANGVYQATLTADNNGTTTCTSTKTLNINVTSYCNIAASFSTTQYGGGVVGFQSTTTGTTGPAYYSWNFGDGSSVSAGNNITSTSHQYVNGSYIATLTVSNNSIAPTCVSIYTQNVSVSSNTCNILPSFTYTVGANGVVNFSASNSGTSAVSNYMWNYGNWGSTGSGATTTYTYPTNGTYTVNLTAIGASSACVQSTSQIITITTSTCVANAQFSVTPTATAQVWNVIPVAPGNVAAAQWMWGDGQVSNTLYTSHSYSTAGTYTICLSVTVTCGAISQWCGSYYINKSSQDMSMIFVNVVPPSSPTGIQSNAINAANFQVYPNPSNGTFKVELENATELSTIKVYNAIGKLVYETSATESSKEIKLDNMSSGVYFIRINSGSSNQTKKLIIK